MYIYLYVHCNNSVRAFHLSVASSGVSSQRARGHNRDITVHSNFRGGGGGDTMYVVWVCEVRPLLGGFRGIPPWGFFCGKIDYLRHIPVHSQSNIQCFNPHNYCIATVWGSQKSSRFSKHATVQR